jgi:tetratricopeptide (TPR) repeat protein
MDMRRTEEALAYHREAVRIRRQLNESYPHLFDSDLASSLHNLAKALAQEGHAAEAFERIDEAIEIYAYLATLGPGIYGPKLMEVTISRSMIPDAPALMSQYRAHKRQLAKQKKREKQKRKKPGRKRRK